MKFTSVFSQNKADDIIGIWLTNGPDPAKIEISKAHDKYYGKIIWLKFPEDANGVKKDINNPIKELRFKSIIGLTILRDFTFNKKSKWIDGLIYDPENGKTYSCNIKLKDKNTLEVRGYIGVSLLGRTEVWRRI
jgi:uncharacterized protein (DUF2147 family)